MSEVKAGQWWTEKGSMGQRHRLCVIGFTTDGSVVVQWFGGRVSNLPMDYFLRYKEHLPNCTGFDWELEYPQYRETYDPSKYAFVRLDSEYQLTYVLLDGTETEPTKNQPYFWGNIEARKKLTEEEALARIVKPKTRVFKVHTVAYGFFPEPSHCSLVTDAGLKHMTRDWKHVYILKTEEFEVPCEQ